MVRSYLGYSPVIPTSCYVDISAQIIGQVELGEHSSVWMNAVLRGDVHFIRIGKRHGLPGIPAIVGDDRRHLVGIEDAFARQRSLRDLRLHDEHSVVRAQH